MAQNGISTEVSGDPTSTKLKRRSDKLALAQTSRQTHGPTYRPLNQLTGTHSAYVNGVGGSALATEGGTAAPTTGHPWSLDPAWVSGLGSDAEF
jgi:hypothetical protein